MTNNEKFFKTFGVELREHADLCDFCICDKRGCLDCPLGEHSFEYNEYKAPANTFSKDIPFKDTKQLLLDALSKHSDAVIATAYSFAYYLDRYGVDVSEKWDNEVENTGVLERAYNKGYFDALLEIDKNKNRGDEKGKWIYEPNCWLRCSCCGSHFPHISIYKVKGSKYCPNCGKEMESEVAYD